MHPFFLRKRKNYFYANMSIKIMENENFWKEKYGREINREEMKFN